MDSPAWFDPKGGGVLLGTPLSRPVDGIFADLSALVDRKVHLIGKLEFFNAAGSIKIKPAVELVQRLRGVGRIGTETVLVDTSSGNMGVALAMVSRVHGLGCLCVTDQKITRHNRALIEAYGGTVHIMPRSRHVDRCEYISALEAADSRYVWTRQFEDVANPESHEVTTAREIFASLPRVDAIIVGVGTGGTIAGCADLRDRISLDTQIIAVDPAGSRHFSQSRSDAIRRIPGIGATERSRFLDRICVDNVVVVSDLETVRACLAVAERTGWLLGGSSGSVIHAAVRSAQRFKDGAVLVAICADSGERYLDTIYNAEWRAQLT